MKARVSFDVGGLKLHSAPGNTSAVVDIAAPGDRVDLHNGGQANTKGWVYATYKGQHGWMWRAHLVEIPEGRIPPPPIPPRPRIEPVSWNLNLWLAVGVALVVGLVLYLLRG